jgi:uncharacterized protein YdhG (YjbR/CyaY superfamily)
VKAGPTTIDDYLAALPPDQRAALQRLREQIHAAAPGAEECISYGMPGFRKHGVLVWMGAARRHCAFYPHGLTEAQLAELTAYDTSRGTIRFQPDNPLPEALVRALVERRVREDAEKAAAAKAKRAKPR